MPLMDKGAILHRLQEHAPQLREAGILHLRVFGSVAREQAGVHSDVDLLAEFDDSKHLTLLTISRLQYQLEELLESKVDLTSLDWMKERVRRRVLSEAELAF